jgi:HK97 family phage portal protein
MSLLNRIKSAFTKKGYSATPSAQAGGTEIMAYQAGYRQRLTKSDAIDDIKSWVWISLDMNARMIASACLRLYAIVPDSDMPKHSRFRITTKAQHRQLEAKANTYGVFVPEGYKIIEVLDHPANTLLHEINNRLDHQTFMRENVHWLQGTGDSYWYVVRGSDGVMNDIPQELWMLNSTRVTVVPDKKNYIKGYIYSTGSARVAIPAKNIIHFREPNLASEFYGMGRIQAVSDAISSYNAYQRYENNNANNPIPNVVVSIKGQSLSVAQRRELLAEYDRLISNQGGVMRSNVLGIEDDSVEFKNLSFNPKDMQFIEGRRWNREEIVNAFGQSVALFTDTASRANVDGALYRWSKFELDPDLKLIAGVLNEQLLPMYDLNVPMFFEYDPITTDDAPFVLAQETADVQNNIRSINEIRSDRGLQPIEDERANDPFYSGAPQSTPFALSLDSSKRTTAKNNNIAGSYNGSSGDNYLEDDMLVSITKQSEM